MSGDPEFLLEAENVEVRFGGVKALDGIDFALRKGELRCLIGPNGAGKTTFFRCLTGRLRPTRGRLRFRGQDLAATESFRIARSGIGIKTQVPSLFDHLTAHEHLWLSLRTVKRAEDREKTIAQVFDRVGIAHLAGMVVGRMAHGQRQLVELAMVIAANPDLILLDEPAAGMTQEENGRLIEIIREINRSHTIVVVEHDMQFIRQIASAVTVFNQGRILMEGNVEAVLSDPAVRAVYLGDGYGH
jgi:ABC-type uncharacterized transport system ATPase subunit